ncbi:MAG: hypothetical protein HPY85_16075 [Anaerolineae bacterium]|nr:hypothetical protein [Anaerolineae bacterium]
MKKNWISLFVILMIGLMLFSSAYRPVAGAAEPLPPDLTLGGVHWIVEIDIPQSAGIASSAADLESQVRGLMPAATPLQVWVASGSSPNGPVYTIHIEGDNTDVMRLIIYDLLSPIVDVSSLPMELSLSGAVSKGSSLAVLFSGIPSTGAKFLVDGLGSLFSLKSSEYECKGVGPGGQNLQTILLDALRDGTALLKFFYQQAWEDVLQYFPVRITIEAGDLKGTFDFSDPSMVFAALEAFSAEPLQSVGALPASLDWSTSNNPTGAPAVSAVKHQGSCGSCWAFATVAVMESVMMIHGVAEQDLSEQYLVSCNTDGWSCNGGWDVHEYHIDKNGKSSNQPGAVLEADLPYTASNGTCSNISDHPYLLTSRHDVDNTVEALKTALYTYGPVWTTLCAAPLQSYTGGVITEGSCSQVDHAVVLVGWDDSTESWKVKNSWGAGWGENGYFRIRWGVSGIGQYSNYVMYNGEDVLPDDPTPTWTFTPEPDAATETPSPLDPTKTPEPEQATNTPKPDDGGGDDEQQPQPTETPVPQQIIAKSGFHDDTELQVFAYSGAWYVYEGKEPFKGSTHFSYTDGSKVTFSFQGVRFFIGYTADHGQGVMKITVDKRWVFYVNQYNASLAWQKLWKSPDFGAGTHTVQITHLGGRQIDLDYIVVE